MVVKFSKQNSNYTQQNIIDILSVASMQNPLIYNLMMSPHNYILVEGDIHRSQFTADNTKNNFWFKIKGFTSDGMPLAELSAAHIYVCFRKIIFDYRTQQYVIGGCINPRPFKGTDLADISRMRGTWEFVKMTYGLSPKNYFQLSNKAALRKPVKKSPSKKLQIIDPKTGKPIKIGGAKKKVQKGGSSKLQKMKEKINQLYSEHNDLESLYEEDKDDEIADQRDDTYLQMEKLTVKYLKAGGKFSELELSSNWRKSDFQNGGGKTYKYSIGMKYRKETEKFMKSVRQELEKAFKSLDYKKDINAGKKLEKLHNEIILKYLIKINKLKVDNHENLEILDEVEQAIKNENPVQYKKFKLKAKKLRRIVYKISKKSTKNLKTLKKNKKSIKEIMKMLITRKKKNPGKKPVKKSKK